MKQSELLVFPLSVLLLSGLGSSQTAEKVKVGIYYESCCPDTQDFIVKSLAPAWNTDGFQNITDIVMPPWGHETFQVSQNGQYSFSCQHGKNECIGQTLQSCAIVTSNFDQSKYIPWVIAMETDMLDQGCSNSKGCCDPTNIGEKYADQYGIDWDATMQCVQSETASISATMAQWQLTDAIYPTLNYVPWITLNGKNNHEIQNGCTVSLLACVCAVYQGDSPACY